MYLQADLKLPFIMCLEMVKKYQEFPLFLPSSYPSSLTISSQWDSVSDRKLKVQLIFPASAFFKPSLSWKNPSQTLRLSSCLNVLLAFALTKAEFLPSKSVARNSGHTNLLGI